MPQLQDQALQQLFTEARTHHVWPPQTIDDATIFALYDLCKWGPTSANTCPMRIVFVRSATEKDKLLTCVAPFNTEQVRAAPVTAIIAFDSKFYDQLPKLSPFYDYRPMFASNPAIAEINAMRNGSIQGGYFILAARALGLDCGPMSGFDNAAVDAAFLAGTDWRSNFLCNIGHADASKVYPRAPRLAFAEACKIV